MAKAATLTAGETPEKSGPSTIVQIAVLAAMTAVAAGLGFASAGFIAPPPPAQEVGQPAHASAAATGEATDPAPASLLPNAVTLPSLTTNLASPSDIWARMELVLVYEGVPDPAMTETIHQDLLAFLRTVKMQQIEGGSGLQHLRADIEDRVNTRSNGKVTRVLIRTLLFE